VSFLTATTGPLSRKEPIASGEGANGAQGAGTTTLAPADSIWGTPRSRSQVSLTYLGIPLVGVVQDLW
jgi:hypothetical protein